MKDPAFIEALRKWNADVIAVAAFGRILPPAILTLPPRGCINVHGSLLPKFRGAGPVQWAIIRGEQETGITTMLMDEGMDTGAMLLQERIAIAPDDTAGSLAPRLAEVGGRLLIGTLQKLEN
jgi:methionyl-tRNA formyltransferase